MERQTGRVQFALAASCASTLQVEQNKTSTRREKEGGRTGSGVELNSSKEGRRDGKDTGRKSEHVRSWTQVSRETFLHDFSSFFMGTM